MRFGIPIDATLHAKLMLNYMQIGQDSSQLLHAFTVITVIFSILNFSSK
jgi:hypothetical protein